MKAVLFSKAGEKGKEVELPEVFGEKHKPETIKRAFTSSQSKKFQPKGNWERAGLDTSAHYVGRRRAYRSGINVARARLPTTVQGGGGKGDVKIVPHAKGGRRAHPPKPEKILVKNINKKEKRVAMRSAIAATANKTLVEKRGHKLEGTVPIIVENSFEEITKTKEMLSILQKIGIGKDLERTRKRSIRAGKMKRRGKKYRTKKSALIVTTKPLKAGKNIPGIEITTAASLNIEQLAPGANAGRLTIFTEEALAKVGEKYRN